MRYRSVAWIAAAVLLPGCGGGEVESAPVDPRPDLQIVRVHMDLMPPASTLIAEIRNTGSSAARGFDCRCYWVCPGRSLYNTELRIMEDGSLDAGGVSSFSIDAPAHRFGCPGPPPVLDANCVVDDRGKIDELDENNNGWSGPIRLTW